MRTAEERLEILHNRADQLIKKRETAWRRGLGGASGALAICLVALISVYEEGGHRITGSGYAGTSLLSESAGGYVIIAVIAFAVGVAVTAALIKYRKN